MGGTPQNTADDQFKSALEAKLVDIDAQIEKLNIKKTAIQELLGETDTPTITSGLSAIGANSFQKHVKLVGDNFHNMPVPNAILEYLRIVDRPARPYAEIHKAINDNGAKSSGANTYTALARLVGRKKLEKVGDNYGLYNWYDHKNDNLTGAS